MSSYQYRVVPAPTKGQKAKGLKTPEDRFAQTLEDLMNQMGAEGWEYQRAETLPSIERAGLTGSATEWRNVLVFRKAASAEVTPFTPIEVPSEAPDEADAKQEPQLNGAQGEAEAARESDSPELAATENTSGKDEDRPAGLAGAVKMQIDNGVEEASEVSGMTNTLKTLATRRFSSKRHG